MKSKCEDLFRKSKWCKFSNLECVINFSNFSLSSDMKCVLGYGLSFCLPPDDSCLTTFLSNFQSFECSIGEKFDVLKGFILNDLISKMKKICFPRRLANALFVLKKNREIVVTKADKGNKVVIMNKLDYVAKLDDIVGDISTYESINSNPLKIWQRAYNSSIKTLLKEHPNLAKRFNSYLPQLPFMYGLPKIHKPNNSLRPIISSVNSVTYSFIEICCFLT